jgi:hypothetical protein
MFVQLYNYTAIKRIDTKPTYTDISLTSTLNQFANVDGPPSTAKNVEN